jgi:hypothetical protein
LAGSSEASWQDGPEKQIGNGKEKRTGKHGFLLEVVSGWPEHQTQTLGSAPGLFPRGKNTRTQYIPQTDLFQDTEYLKYMDHQNI